MQTILQLRKEQQTLKRLLAKREGEADKIKRAIEKHRKTIVRLEQKLAHIVGKAVSLKDARSTRKEKKRSGPSQKDIVRQILAESGKPLSIDDIFEKMKQKGYKWQASDPQKGLGVLLYRNKKLFKKMKPGMFTVASQKAE